MGSVKLLFIVIFIVILVLRLVNRNMIIIIFSTNAVPCNTAATLINWHNNWHTLRRTDLVFPSLQVEIAISLVHVSTWGLTFSNEGDAFVCLAF